MALAIKVYQLLSNTELALIVISTIVKRVRPLVKSLGLIIEAFLIKFMRRSVKNYYFLVIWPLVACMHADITCRTTFAPSLFVRLRCKTLWPMYARGC
jgi:hypothetical protein